MSKDSHEEATKEGSSVGPSIPFPLSLAPKVPEKGGGEGVEEVL